MAYYHDDWQMKSLAGDGHSGLPGLAFPLYDRHQPLPPHWQWLSRSPNRVYPVSDGWATEKPQLSKFQKVRTTVPLNWLARLTPQSSDHGSMLSAAAVLFSAFLTRQCRAPSAAAVWVPKWLNERYSELNGAYVTSGLSRVVLPVTEQGMDNREYTLSDLIQRAESQRSEDDEKAGPDVTPADSSGSFDGSDDLQVMVTWMVDSSVHLRLLKAGVETLRLPPLNSDADLILAIGLNCDNQLVAELTTGERISPYIGAALLDRFIEFVKAHRLNEPLTAPASAIQVQPDPAFTADESVTESHTQTEPQLKPKPEKSASAEQTILQEFQLALSAPQMSAEDDFFDCGGYSLIATRVIGRLKNQYGIDIRINDLFSHPTAKALAIHAVPGGVPEKTRQQDYRSPAPGCPADSAPECESINKDEAATAPLSLAQQSLWQAYAAFGYNELFNIPFTLRFLQTVDEPVFAAAFQDVMIRHPILRSTFTERDKEVKQQVVPLHRLQEYQWFFPSDMADELSVKERLNREACFVFCLVEQLPVRLHFVTDRSTGIQYLSFLFHHIVLDEWSVNLMMDELRYAYAQRVTGQAPVWSVQPLPFHAFAQKQRREGLSVDHLNFWLEHLEGAGPQTPLLSKLSRRAGEEADTGNQTTDAGGWVEISLENATSTGLYRLAKQENASLFNVVYTAIAIALRTLGAPDQLIVGTPASGRLDTEYFDTIGYFTTLAMHRVCFTAAEDISGLIRQVRNNINDSLPYTDVPIDDVEAAMPGPSACGQHRFEVMIQLHAKNKLHGELTGPDGERILFEQVDPEKSDSALGLQFEVMEETAGGENRIRVLMSYRSDHYTPSQVRQLSQVTRETLDYFARPDAAQQPLMNGYPLS